MYYRKLVVFLSFWHKKTKQKWRVKYSLLIIFIDFNKSVSLSLQLNKHSNENRVLVVFNTFLSHFSREGHIEKNFRLKLQF